MAQSNPLSNREAEVVELLLQGKSNKMIAASLGISIRTVEFHLKNIYTKYQVNSRIELVLKLGKTTGEAGIKKLGPSTVDNSGESAENRNKPKRAASFKDTVFGIGKELEMKNLLRSKHVPIGVVTALLTGLLWVTVFKHFGHMSSDSIKPWVLPIVLVLALIGLSVGLAAKRNGNAPLKIFLSTMFGTGAGAFAMIPLTGFVLYPLGKFAEWLGLIDRSAISTDLTSTLVIVAMLIMWLLVGGATGIMLLSVTIGKPRQANNQQPAPEHSL